MAGASLQVSKPEKAAVPEPEATPSSHLNSSKSLSHFLYKAALVTIFLVLLPLFPVQAPEFINQTLHSRSWELVQLVLVGIAVSYGLFSKKNDDVTTSEKEHSSSKLDNAQSYVSKLLQVSSVFDDESECQTVIDENNNSNTNNNKVQTWNSKYYRRESPVVREESSGVRTSGLVNSQKPLLLPVRSLKQRVPEPEEVEPAGPENRSSGSTKLANSNSLRKQKNGEFAGTNSSQALEENVVVLRSPIPWRSRSGRLLVEEMKKANDADGRPSNSTTDPQDQDSAEPKNRLESKSFRSFRLNSSPKSTASSESQAKGVEDVMMNKQKNFSPAPPPPPPPPPPFHRNPNALLTKSNSSSRVMADIDASSSQKVLWRSARSVPAAQEPIISTDCEPPRMINNSVSELKISATARNDNGLQLGKSVRTFRTFSTHDDSVKKADDHEKISRDSEANFVEKNKQCTVRPKNEKTQTYSPKEEEDSDHLLVDKVLVETTDEEDSEAGDEIYDHFEGGSGNANGEAAVDNGVNEVGPDVDKKADEFIAKFREQIRLQRIESIRRSTALRSGKPLR